MASGSIRYQSGNDQYLLSPTHLRGRTLPHSIGRSLSSSPIAPSSPSPSEFGNANASRMSPSPSLSSCTSSPSTSPSSPPTTSLTSSPWVPSSPPTSSTCDVNDDMGNMYARLPSELRPLIAAYVGDLRHLLLMTHDAMYLMQHRRLRTRITDSGNNGGHDTITTTSRSPRIISSSTPSRALEYGYAKYRDAVTMICEAEYPVPERTQRFSNHANMFHNGNEQIIDVPGIDISDPYYGPAVAWQTLLLGNQRETVSIHPFK
jgi:hypothetical protein